VKIKFHFSSFCSLLVHNFVANIKIYNYLMGQKKEHSNLIKEHLKKRGITQTWLAKELGMSFSITNAYVCNRKQPNLANIFKVADLLGVSAKYLVK